MPFSRMRMRTRILLAASVLMMATLGGAVWWAEQSTADTASTIAALSGDGRIMRAGAEIPDLADLRSHDVVLAGMTPASVSYPDGTSVVMDPGAQARFEDVTGAKRVHLVRGGIQVSAAKQGADAPMVIATAQAEATVVGTRFSMAIDGERTRLVVAEGVVRFTDSRGSIEVAQGGAAVSAPVGSTGTRLRVLTWNVDHGERNVFLQAKAIADAGADLVALQQVASPAAVAVYVGEIERITGVPWHSAWAAEKPGKETCCIISRFPLLASDVRDIGPSSFGGSRRAVHGRVAVSGRNLAFVTTYLDWVADDTVNRAENLRQLLEWTATLPVPQILTGGFRSYHDSTFIDTVRSRYDDAWQEVAGTTIGPATKGRRIDYVFRSRDASQAIVPVRSWVLDTGLSDHKALLTDYLVAPP